MFCLLAPCQYQGFLLLKQPSGEFGGVLDLRTLSIFSSNAVLVERGVALSCDLSLGLESLFCGMGAGDGWWVFLLFVCAPCSQALSWSLSIRPDLPTFTPLILREPRCHSHCWADGFGMYASHVPEGLCLPLQRVKVAE